MNEHPYYADDQQDSHTHDALDAMRARRRMIQARMSVLHERAGAESRRMTEDEAAQWAELDADLAAHDRAIPRLAQLVEGPRSLAQLQARNAVLCGRVDDIVAACAAEQRGMTELEGHVFDQARADAAATLSEIQRLEHEARMAAVAALTSGSVGMSSE